MKRIAAPHPHPTPSPSPPHPHPTPPPRPCATPPFRAQVSGVLGGVHPLGPVSQQLVGMWVWPQPPEQPTAVCGSSLVFLSASSAHSLPDLCAWGGGGGSSGRGSSGEPGCSSLCCADESHRGTPACRLCVKFTAGPDGWCCKDLRGCLIRCFLALRTLASSR